MGILTRVGAAVAAVLLAAAPVHAQPPAWNPAPWLQDLGVARDAFRSKYANLEWLLTEREVDLDALFGRAERALAGARGDAEAMQIFNRLVQRVADGHVSIDWPRPPAPAPTPAPAPAAPAPAAPAAPLTAEAFCRGRGYDSPPPGRGVAPALPGYVPIAEGDVFPAGTARVGGARFGFVRIDVFQPQALSLCTGAIEALAIRPDAPCDQGCADRLITEAYRRLSGALEDRLLRLRAAGAEILVVDITGNGGGSEWTEAAARMLSRRPLQSARLAFVRGEHWTRLWREQAERLRGFAEGAAPADRARLLAWAAEADAARAEAERRCPPSGDSACPWLGRAGYATGLVGRAPSGSFAGRDWAVHVFNPAQHAYRDGVWDGPALVLTDQETWSAAEQFAAILQDNRAALIVGARTGGSGCGHTWGGTPTRLPNSGATLRLPDCVRLRADGSNEVSGVMPDLAVAWRPNDGRAFRARLLAQALAEAARRARALHRARTSPAS